MEKRVVKFGGSVLNTYDNIKKIINVIKSYDKNLIIIVSAIKGITDLLYIIAKQSLKKKELIFENIKKIFNIHFNLISRFDIKQDRLEAFNTEFRNRIDNLEKKLLGIHYLQEIPVQTLDEILSFGERFSSLVLNHIFNSNGINIEEKLPEEIGIFTDGKFQDSSINLTKSSKKILNSLKDKKNYIIPGFYGISDENKITILGRGGSDYSASAIAYCINAKSLDFWKDVNGFMTGDPKVIKFVKEIKKLSYEEAAELSYFGAKILHPRSFEPVMEKDIKIRIFHIDNYKKLSTPSTIITKNNKINENVIKSITAGNGMGILKLSGPGVGIKPGIMAKVTNMLNENHINIKSILTSQISINILLSKSDLNKSYKLITKTNLIAVEDISKRENIGVIAAVGNGITKKYGIAARIFNSLAREKINIEIISMGASPVAIYLIVKDKDKDRALKSLHKEFFNENN